MSMSVVFENVATGTNDNEINDATSKRKIKGTLDWNIKDGDKIIVKIVADVSDIGYYKDELKNPLPKGKPKSFYAIVEIDIVETKDPYGFLLHDQPTMKSKIFKLEDGKKEIKIRKTFETDPAIMTLKRKYGLPGIHSNSHLIAKTSQQTNKPSYSAVLVDESMDQLPRSFVYVYFSGLNEMTDKMLNDQKKAVNGWFKEYIEAFEPLFQEKINKKIKEDQEQRRREADPEFQRKRKEYQEKLYEKLYGSRSTASTSTAPNGKVDEWSTACSGVSEFDTHLKTLGINRETDAATRHLFGQMKKEKALLVHPDRCPTSFETATQEQKKWFKRTFGGNVKEKPESKEECDDYMKRVNNATDQISNCALKE